MTDNSTLPFPERETSSSASETDLFGRPRRRLSTDDIRKMPPADARLEAELSAFAAAQPEAALGGKINLDAAPPAYVPDPDGDTLSAFRRWAEARLEALKQSIENEKKETPVTEQTSAEARHSATARLMVNGIEFMLTSRSDDTAPDADAQLILNMLASLRTLLASETVKSLAAVRDNRNHVTWFKGAPAEKETPPPAEARQSVPPVSPFSKASTPAANPPPLPETQSAGDGVNVEDVAFIKKIFNQEGKPALEIYPMLRNGKPGERPCFTARKGNGFDEVVRCLNEYEVDIEQLPVAKPWSPPNAMRFTWKRGKPYGTEGKFYRDFVAVEMA